MKTINIETTYYATRATAARERKKHILSLVACGLVFLGYCAVVWRVFPQ